MIAKRVWNNNVFRAGLKMFAIRSGSLHKGGVSLAEKQASVMSCNNMRTETASVIGHADTCSGVKKDHYTHRTTLCGLLA